MHTHRQMWGHLKFTCVYLVSLSTSDKVFTFQAYLMMSSSFWNILHVSYGTFDVSRTWWHHQINILKFGQNYPWLHWCCSYLCIVFLYLLLINSEINMDNFNKWNFKLVMSHFSLPKIKGLPCFYLKYLVAYLPAIFAAKTLSTLLTTSLIRSMLYLYLILINSKINIGNLNKWYINYWCHIFTS